MKSASDRTDTREKLLDVAQELIQRRGYNAVSYRDLAQRVKVKTASIHYHFPSKEDLGCELVRRYRSVFAGAREQIDRDNSGGALGKLQRYLEALCKSFESNHRMCLGGILAAEASTLPRTVTDEVKLFFRENESWLGKVLEEGRRDRTLEFGGASDEAARVIFGMVEGGLMSACTFGEEQRVSATARWILSSLERG